MNKKKAKLKAQSSKGAISPVEEGSSVTESGELSASAYPMGALDEGLILRENSQAAPRHDLPERTARFGESIVRFSRRIPRDPTNLRLISQLVGAGTSVGANYCEANEAVSPKDFKYTISRCVKEAKETKFFLRMVAASEPGLAPSARLLYREAHELLLIFGAMRHRK